MEVRLHHDLGLDLRLPKKSAAIKCYSADSVGTLKIRRAGYPGIRKQGDGPKCATRLRTTATPLITFAGHLQAYLGSLPVKSHSIVFP